jgi:hypothetical protein
VVCAWFVFENAVFQIYALVIDEQAGHKED